MDTGTRFWSKVDVRGDDDCWNWTAAIDTPGYGAFKLNGKKIGSHVVAFILTHGEVPAGKEVCHTCVGNRLCCNPRHLYAGSRLENIQDAIRAGTHHFVKVEVVPHGQDVPNSMLSNEQVEEIKSRLSAGETCISISRDYPVSKWAIYKIKEKKSWISV